MPVASIHHLGEGWEPHVDELDGVITYSIPVAAGFVERSFEFVLRRDQLDVLVIDRWRRAVLFHTLHTLLQHSMVKDDPVGQERFAALAAHVLCAPRIDVERFIDEIDGRYDIRLRAFIEPDH